MTESTTYPSPDSWLCIQTQPRRDQVAAGHLRQIEGIDVFAPQIQYRALRKGVKVKRTEPLFPGYVFARFDFVPLHRLVRLTPGVSRILEFGGRCATLDESTISALRELTGTTEVREVTPPGPESGEIVAIEAGPFAGSTGTVLDWKPAHERVRVLVELMGREVLTEVSLHDLTRSMQIRSAVFRAET